MKTSSSRICGFSLIELLVVMAIIGIIAAFAVPAASTILRGSQMTQASQILTDQINLARQAALARNHVIEVRFIRFTDPETPGDTGPDGLQGNFHAIWVFEDSGALDHIGNLIMVPVDKPAMFPQSVVLSTSANFSTILTNQASYTTQGVQPGVNDPAYYPRTSLNYPNGVGYTYVAFRFNPDGSTNLLPMSNTTTQWFVTLQNINDRPTGTTPPPNFFTLLIDSVMGTVKSYRPGV